MIEQFYANYASIILFFVFGLIVGSFLNALIYRFNTGLSMHGRSCCMQCGKCLSWYELVPILSFILLRGKCSACKSKISIQYLLVELVTGILFALYAYKKFILAFDANSVLIALLSLVIIAILVFISVYDIRHKIIPDSFSYLFALLSLVLFFISNNGLQSVFWHLAAGPIFFFPFFLLWYLSRGKWMGFGDAKLAWGIGWFLGIFGGVNAILLGFWIGAVISVIMLAIPRIFHRNFLSGNLSGLTIKSEVPFGPFLIIGTLLVYFFDLNVLFWSL